ncbi:GntR family transcriptional regulator (plasmid) [Streptomyces yangpuensis]|uniref:GntR family transcriptional regulator n=1 Tax=Streptomyces yangpuensis TaxID=1648182 RepID=A0ABY5Q8Z7_9ACTN|nr:GntR family transcriptional regulator [Streptomyces yangpuensis]UUY52784.1 GntR family transcriptional regulator [Streptomyces yangpuensis]
MTSSGDLSAELRQRITAGELAVGSKLPTNAQLMAKHGVSKATVTKAIATLADEGLVYSSKRAGTIVRSTSPIALPLSRYGQVLAPGGAKGPWETATAALGLDGHMKFVSVERVRADSSLAVLLDLREGDELVYRVRQAVIMPSDVVQLQHSWYPASIAEAAGLDRDGKVVGGVYGALTSAGHQPTRASETVSARMPTEDEAAQLRVGGRVWVIAIERLTRDAQGRALEVMRAVAPADRLQLTYDDLPLLEG